MISYKLILIHIIGIGISIGYISLAYYQHPRIRGSTSRSSGQKERRKKKIMPSGIMATSVGCWPTHSAQTNSKLHENIVDYSESDLSISLWKDFCHVYH